jgi:hypothetical protein
VPIGRGDGGDLLVRQPLELAQHHRFAEGERQRLEALAQQPAVRLAQQLDLGVGAADADLRMDLLVEWIDDLVAPLPLLQEAVERVADDGEQPGAGVGAVEAVEKLQRPQDGGLQHVLGVRIVAGQPAGQIVRGVEMGQDGAVEAAPPVVLSEKAIS